MSSKRKIQVRYGNSADRPTLATGEIGLDTNTGSEAVYIGTPAGNKQIALASNVSGILVVNWAQDFGTSATTLYQVPGSDLTNANVNNRAMPMPFACTLSNLYIYSSDNDYTSSTATVTVYKNGVATALSIVLTAGSDTGSNTSDSVSFAAGDTFAVGITISGGGSGGLFYPTVSVKYVGA